MHLKSPAFSFLFFFLFTDILNYKQSKLISKISVKYSVYDLCMMMRIALLHRLLCCIKSLDLTILVTNAVTS